MRPVGVEDRVGDIGRTTSSEPRPRSIEGAARRANVLSQLVSSASSE
jgi:hypothetical protein